MTRPDPGEVLGLGALAIILTTVTVLVYLAITAPKCLKGHEVPRWVPENCYPSPMEIGEVTIYIMNCDPAHWTQDFVCDQWEVERE